LIERKKKREKEGEGGKKEGEGGERERERTCKNTTKRMLSLEAIKINKYLY